MPAACNPSKIVAALHEEAEIITDIVRENIKQSPRLALRMVPDGGVVRRHSNQDSIIYGEARQAPVAYHALDHSVKAMTAGEMTGRTLQGVNGIYGTDINQIADNACHGQVTIDFAQGYRIRRTVDYGIDLDTPIKCARELDRLGEAHIRGYFKGFQEQFTRFGLDNFSDNLINLMIQQGEANASILGPNQFNVTRGGWSGPPAYRLSIHFLQDYRDHIVATMRGRGIDVPEDWHLEIEAPVNDWIDAVRADQVNRMGATHNGVAGTGISATLNSEWFKDEEGAMKGRRFHTYGGIKCYFNESPIRGYFLPVGTGVYRFVRVMEWVNEVSEENEGAGLVVNANHQYREEAIYVDGVKYDMVTLIPHIDPRSFKRYGLIKPLKPIGGANAGVNYEVRVLEGAKIACNTFDDKFALAARHEFRFKAEYPEFSGYIAYRHSRRTGYVISVSGRVYGAESDTAAAGPEQFATGAPDDCSVAECAQCDKVVGENKKCVAEDAVPSPLDTVGLVPAGAKTVAYFGGADEVLKVGVERLGGGQGEVTVTYAVTESGGPVTAVGATVLTWANGDTATKFIEIPILEDAVDTDTVTVTLTSPTGATRRIGADVFTGTINKL